MCIISKAQDVIDLINESNEYYVVNRTSGGMGKEGIADGPFNKKADAVKSRREFVRTMKSRGGKTQESEQNFYIASTEDIDPELLLLEQKDIGYISREMLRWFSKCGSNNEFADAARRRQTHKIYDKIWYRKELLDE